ATSSVLLARYSFPTRRSSDLADLEEATPGVRSRHECLQCSFFEREVDQDLRRSLFPRHGPLDSQPLPELPHRPRDQAFAVGDLCRNVRVTPVQAVGRDLGGEDELGAGTGIEYPDEPACFARPTRLVRFGGEISFQDPVALENRCLG